MFSLRNVYIALMLVAGVALAIAVTAWPAIAAAPVPPIMWLLLISLVIDVTAMAIAAQGGQAPLGTNTRIIGFFGAALLYILITAARGAPIQ